MRAFQERPLLRAFLFGRYRGKRYICRVNYRPFPCVPASGARFGSLAALCIGGLLFWLLLPAVDSIAAPQRAPPGSYYNANSVRSSDSLRLLNIQPAPQDRRELKRPPIFFSCSDIGFVLPITAIAFSE